MSANVRTQAEPAANEGKRSAVEAVGGYRHVFNSEDTDLYWRLLELGRLHNLPAFLGLYRMHSGSVSSGNVLVGAVAAQLAAISAGRPPAGRGGFTPPPPPTPPPNAAGPRPPQSASTPPKGSAAVPRKRCASRS